MEAFHCLVAAEKVFYGACHHMVDAGHAVGRGRSLKEHERRSTFAQGYAAAEEVGFTPTGEHLLVYVREVERGIFLELFHL